MNRKIATLIGTLALTAAGSALSTEQPHHSSVDGYRTTISVLVEVDAQGDATRISPAIKLPDALDHLLHTSIVNHMQVYPVRDQFLAHMAMEVIPVDDDHVTVQFLHVSSKELPKGSWYWANTDEQHPMLASESDNNAEFIQRIRPFYVRGDAPGIKEPLSRY